MANRLRVGFGGAASPFVLKAQPGNYFYAGTPSQSTYSGGQNWQFSDLITGFNPFVGQSFLTGQASWGIQNDGSTSNTAVWSTDGSGSFLRITSNQPGTYGLRFGTNVTGLREFCLQYSIRRSSNLCSKQAKTYGSGFIIGGNTSNCTFGCTMGGYSGATYGIYYGDNASGSNDVSTAYAATGYPTNNLPNIGFGSSFTRTPYPTQSVVSALDDCTQDISGTVWETWMLYFLASSPSTADGRIIIWKMISGAWKRLMDMTNLWNCSSTTSDRGGFGLYEYSSNSGFVEDYSKVYWMFAAPVGMP